MTAKPVVVVTGAGAGAGRAIAVRFGREGWRVALLSRDPDRLAAAQREIEALGGEALAIPTDVAERDQVFAARDRVLEAWGDIDAWVNCAMATVVGPIAELSGPDFERVVQVTLMGYVYGTQAALEVMRRKDRGAIVQVGSALAYRAIPLQAAYCACKFAIRGFTDSLRGELAHNRSRIKLTMVQMPGMNTLQFDWAKNLFRHKYQPVGTVYDPDVAAEGVWRAVRSGPREIWVGASTLQAIVGEIIFPPLLDRIVAKSGIEGQISATPETPGRPDNLYAPVKRDAGARGRFSDKARPTALTLDSTHLRLGVYGAILGLIGAAAATGFTAGRRRLRPAPIVPIARGAASVPREAQAPDPPSRKLWPTATASADGLRRTDIDPSPWRHPPTR